MMKTYRPAPTREQVQQVHEATTQLKYRFFTARRRYRDAMEAPIFTPEHTAKIAELKTQYHALRDEYNEAAERANEMIEAYNKACGQVPDHRENVYAEHAKKR